MAGLVTRPLSDFVDAVASSSPAPGGGSVSALAGALGAALGSMVARLTAGKPGYDEVEAEARQALNRLEALRKEMLQLVDADTEAFSRVSAAFSMPKDSGNQKLERSRAIQDALKGAARVPLRLAGRCSAALDTLRVLAAKGNPSAASDVGVGALMLYAGLQGAALNVEINLKSIRDQDFCARAQKELEGSAAFTDDRLREILATCRSRMG
ncbi:MAG: cyclodeaminase/cyclohydrolase family protein [Thermoplasmatota archaeon]